MAGLISYYCDFCEAYHPTMDCTHPRYENPDELTKKVKELESRVDELEGIELDLLQILGERKTIDRDELFERLESVVTAF